MNLRYLLANGAGLFLKAILQHFGRGSALPGKIALKIDPNFIRHAASRQSVLISGTNGKTMTTSLLVASLRQAGHTVRTNEGGANMIQGIATALIGLPRERKRLSVFEVDEATMPLVARDLGAELVVLTNLFKDQSERYSSPVATLELLKQALADLPDTHILANGELPLFHPDHLGREASYYGLGQDISASEEAQGSCPSCGADLIYAHSAYANIGDYHCAACGLDAPALDLSLDGMPELSLNASRFTIEGRPFVLHTAGLYNVANALAAYAAGRALGLTPKVMQEAFSQHAPLEGRQEQLQIADKDITLHLMKNPVGFNQLVELLRLDSEEFGLILMLNDRPADGMDISWIEEGDFAGLVALTPDPPLLGGLRAADLQTHLQGLGVEDSIPFGSFEELSDHLQTAPQRRYHALLTYTAMGEFKAWSHGKGRG